MRALLQLGRIGRRSSPHNCLGSHRTSRPDSFRLRIPHSSKARDLPVEGKAVPGLVPEPAVLAQALARAARSLTA